MKIRAYLLRDAQDGSRLYEINIGNLATAHATVLPNGEWVKHNLSDLGLMEAKEAIRKLERLKKT